jgi:hypothetical protein
VPLGGDGEHHPTQGQKSVTEAPGLRTQSRLLNTAQPMA